MKMVKGLVVAGLAAVLLAGCGSNDGAAGGNTGAGGNNAEQTDATTTASIVNQADAFVSAVSEQGTWIIATLNDLTVDQDVVVAGQFHDKNDETKDIYRKIALYTQDADHNIIDSFTLTIPKLTVQSENLKIQGGTVKGDVYVEANGFSLDKTATIDGNLYFANADVQGTAVVEGTVTGATEVQ